MIHLFSDKRRLIVIPESFGIIQDYTLDAVIASQFRRRDAMRALPRQHPIHPRCLLPHLRLRHHPKATHTEDPLARCIPLKQIQQTRVRLDDEPCGLVAAAVVRMRAEHFFAKRTLQCRQISRHHV